MQIARIKTLERILEEKNDKILDNEKLVERNRYLDEKNKDLIKQVHLKLHPIYDFQHKINVNEKDDTIARLRKTIDLR